MRYTFVITRGKTISRKTIEADTIEDAWAALDEADPDGEIASAHLDDVAP